MVGSQRAMVTADSPAAPLETDSADGVFEGGGVKGIA